MRKYKLHVFTGDVKGAGTDANVFVTIYGEYGDSGERQLLKSETHSNKFERGNVSTYFICLKWYYCFFPLDFKTMLTKQ